MLPVESSSDGLAQFRSYWYYIFDNTLLGGDIFPINTMV